MAFFSKEVIEKVNRGRGLQTCFKCGLYAKCNTPKMEPFGSFKKRIMIIGEAPSVGDDRAGRPWSDKLGNMLKNVLEDNGVDLYKDCISINALSCNTPNNRKPEFRELEICRGVKVIPAIEKYKPELIILLGSSALRSYLAHRWKERGGLGKIDRWRGMLIPDIANNAWICPTFAPAHVLRVESKVTELIWKQDIERALKQLEEPFPKYKKIRFRKIKSLKALDSIKSGRIAFDFETSGLKPQPEHQKIVCGSIAYNDHEVFVFKAPKNEVNWQPFIRIMKNPNISKVAANMMFEDNWCNVKLKTKVVGWEWDTMQAAHVLDNRPGISGLKFQAFVTMGIIDYNSHIESYLRAEYSNDLNKIEKLIEKPEGWNDLLKYCGYDSIYEYRLAELQMKKINYDWLPF